MPKLRAIFLICFLISGSTIPVSLRAVQCDPWIAKLVSIEGRVDIRRHASPRWVVTTLGETYCRGDRIRVAANARASIELSNDTILRLDQRSTLVFPEPAPRAFSFVELLKGALHLISRVKTSLEIRTPFVNAGLEGTEFIVRVLEQETIVSVIEGRVAVSNPHGRLSLAAGQSASGRKDSAPVLRLDLTPEDAVQWAIYYPLITDPDTPGILGEIAEAQRLLFVGRADEARDLIRAVLATVPDNAGALAIASIVELAQNDKDAAMQLAMKAVRAAPESGAALLALSIAQQAHFELDAAIRTVERAIENEPENALAWSRLAELRTSLGDLNGALKAARRAVGLNSDISRTQVVLGFTQLIRFRTTAARASFNRAIELDSADPLARLGLGLAKIRDGELAAGRRDMEIAVSLNPSSSLLRSYLGKAYFEEGRNRLADTELELAKQLDPRDPTPWLYNAVKKHSENRQVEALRDLQQSIQLNDNRAVYRSKLFLDQDAAAGNVNLAAIYSNLGFERLAIRESARSLSGYQSNHAAHRFLATALLGQARQGITQVSELLQAQMYQPVSGRGESPGTKIRELNRYTGLVSPAWGISEYGALFDRQGTSLSVNGALGSQATGGGEVIVSGLSGANSYSLGYLKFDSDGFRDNFDVSQEAYNVFAQSQVTDRLNLQLELMHRDAEQGDLRLSLDPAFVPNERRSLSKETYRVGAHYRPGPDSHVLGVISYADCDERVSRPNLHFTDLRKGVSSELQLTKEFDAFQAVAGVGLYRIDLEQRDRIEIPPIVIPPIVLPPPLPPIPGRVIPGRVIMPPPKKGEVDAESLYLYLTGKTVPGLVWVAGFSLDQYEDTLDGIDVGHFNPKFGFEWDMDEAHRLRGAFFKTVKRNGPVEATLEPTQVAGFSQFFDDFNGVRASNYGLAVDSRLSPQLDSTIAAVQRETHNPANDDELKEKMFNLDLFWKLGNRWSLAGGVRWEYDEFVRGRDFTLRNRSVPLKATYNSPAGYFGSIGVNYVEQNLRDAFNNQIETFTTWDLSLGYLLPNRAGRLTFEVTNLFDEDFSYQDNQYKVSDAFDVHLPYIPERVTRLNLQLSF